MNDRRCPLCNKVVEDIVAPSGHKITINSQFEGFWVRGKSGEWILRAGYKAHLTDCKGMTGLKP